jgi:hypothetical protein
MDDEIESILYIGREVMGVHMTQASAYAQPHI